jgi:hypothetical protein
MSKFTFKNFPRDFYGVFSYVNEDPRISLSAIGRQMGIDRRTATAWWNLAVENRIIIPPILRKKSFLNFREHVYFLKVKDPHKLFKKLMNDKSITYYMVQTGFSNFAITAKEEIDPPGEIIFSGERSDSFVSTPPDCTYEEAAQRISQKLENMKEEDIKPSPLVYHDSIYESWDEKDEIIYNELCNDMRKPFLPIMKKHKLYSDKIMNWIKERDTFGQTFTFFYPEGEGAYLPTMYVMKADYDFLIIDLFSQLPVTSVFYRLRNLFFMTLYIPFPLFARSLTRMVLSRLQERGIIEDYENAVNEYHYRP